MKVNNAFYPASEKYVKSEVKLMSWSPRFDLLVIATVYGELQLYRLVSKEKVWSLAAPDAGVGISSICWRPDGSLIAVSYDSAKHGVHFLAVEKPASIRTLLLKEDIIATILVWNDISKDILSKPCILGQELQSQEYLPKIPVWEFESRDKTKNFRSLEKGKFNILLLGDSTCHITLFANGLFPIVKISCPDTSTNEQKLIAAHMTSGMQNLSVARSCGSSSYCEIYNIENVAKNVKLYEATSDEVYEVLSLETYLCEILTNVSEQCDMVAQEMDSHLISYLTKGSSSERIVDDFMQLLMWGKPTPVLTDIFTNHMTKRGIKKLSTLIESSYSNIQQDLTLNFQNGLMNLYYHLIEMRGMIDDRNQVLPFTSKDADDLISTTGSLLLKTAELLHVIDASLKNFKAFFRWLYISILKIQGEQAEKLGNVSMSEMAFVADFIYDHLSFRGQGEKKSRQFQLEKVYQYLKDEPLSSPIKSTQNEWLNFLSTSNVLSNCKSMIVPCPDLSLRQIFKTLSRQLDKIVRLPKFSHNQGIELLKTVQLPTLAQNETPKVEFVTKTPRSDAVQDNGQSLEPGTYLLFKEKQGFCQRLSFFFLSSKVSDVPGANAIQLFVCHSKDGGEKKPLSICDFDIYDENTITCLLLDENVTKSNYLAQVNLSNAYEAVHRDGAPAEITPSKQLCYSGIGIPSIDISDSCVDVRDLGGKVKFLSVAACGGRKVSCILSSDRHCIQPFLLDGSEEDDDSLLDALSEESVTSS